MMKLVIKTRTDLPARSKQTFWIYDTRDQNDYKTSKPKDPLQAELCFNQAMFGIKDFDIEFEGELWDEELPDEPGRIYKSPGNSPG
jgi:hypothetical protein